MWWFTLAGLWFTLGQIWAGNRPFSTECEPEQSECELLLRTKQDCRNDCNAIGTPVCLRSCRQQDGIDESVAKPFAEPKQVRHLTIGRCRTQFCFECNNSSIRTFDDEVNLAVPVSGAKVKHGGIISCCVNPQTKGNETLEQWTDNGWGASIGDFVDESKSASAENPSRRAAREGSAKWCFGDEASRPSSLRPGSNLGLGPATIDAGARRVIESARLAAKRTVR